MPDVNLGGYVAAALAGLGAGRSGRRRLVRSEARARGP